MKLAVGMIVVALALAFFIFTTFSDKTSNAFLYYYTVAEAVEHPEKIGDENVRIGGRVVPGTIARDPENRTVSFTMADEKKKEHRVDVIFNSSITPDTFKDESEVLVEGKFTSRGAFEAETLFAKCPSRYESEGYPNQKDLQPMPGAAPSSS